MKYLRTGAWPLLGAALAAGFGGFVGGCGGQGSGQADGTAGGSSSGVASGAPEAALVASAPTPSPAQRAARDRAAAEAKRRAAMAIPSWARGQVLRQVPVKAGDKVFALTFDDGPWPESTRQILRILKQYDAKATFYMVGSEVKARPEIVKEIYAAGHALGNHSWSHPARPRSAVSEVKRTNEAIKRAAGAAPTSFRPPYGIVASMAREAQREGQAVLLWSADSLDWRLPGASRIASRILSQASPGGVALMHDGGGHRDQTVAALPRILRSLKARGYELVTVPELLRRRYVAPKPKPFQSKNSKKKARR